MISSALGRFPRGGLGLAGLTSTPQIMRPVFTTRNARRACVHVHAAKKSNKGGGGGKKKGGGGALAGLLKKKEEAEAGLAGQRASPMQVRHAH